MVVSNICINDISQFQFSCILKLFGIKHVQIAPTKLIHWDNLQSMNTDIFTNNNINIYSFQSITYGLSHNIFNQTRSLLLEHLKHVIDCGILNHIEVLVFGCPRNRKILNIDDNNESIFCDFFNELGNYIGNHNLTICIEPNSKKYGCNFMNTIEETGNIVRKINNKNIKLMVDVGNIIMENDNIDMIYKYSDILYNIDIASENMEPFHTTDVHNNFMKVIKNINYRKKINLEMIIKDQDNELDILCNSLNKFIVL